MQVADRAPRFFKLAILVAACTVGSCENLFGEQFSETTGEPVWLPEPLPSGDTLQHRLDALESQLHEQQAVIAYQQEQLAALQHSETTSGKSLLNEFEQKVRLPQIEIGGQYRMLFNSSNFDFHPPAISNDQPTSTYMNQRFRTWLTAHASDHVRGYLQVEMGHILWGDDYDFPKTYTVAPPRDRAGVELRYGYLEYEKPELGLLRAGIQPWDDRFHEMLASSTWDFSVGGLLWRKQTSDGLDLSAGIFQLNENDIHLADDAFLVVTDFDIDSGESHSWGVSGYFLPDRGDYSYPTAPAYDSAWDAWLGIRNRLNLGFADLNSFAIYNTGARDDGGGSPTYRHDGAALRTELAGLQFGPGQWSAQIVYSTGNRDQGGTHSNEFRTIAQSARDNFGAQSYWGYLVISSPHGPSDVNDLGASLQNRGLGLFTAQAKYDYPICERLVGTTACGWLRSDARNPASQSTAMGSELAQMFTFDFGYGLKSDFGAAVFFTGDFYRADPAAASPDDLYEAFTRIQLEF